METEYNEDVMQRLDLIIEYMENAPDGLFNEDSKTLKEVQYLIKDLQYRNKLQAYEIETLKLYSSSIRNQLVVPRYFGFIIVIMAVLSIFCAVLSLII